MISVRPVSSSDAAERLEALDPAGRAIDRDEAAEHVGTGQVDLVQTLRRVGRLERGGAAARDDRVQQLREEQRAPVRPMESR